MQLKRVETGPDEGIEVHGAKEFSMSSELQDRITDLAHTDTKIGLNRAASEIEVGGFDHFNEADMIEGNSPEAQYTFGNLNYVKKKLFDPEIQCILTKFTEQLQQCKEEVTASSKAFMQEYRQKVEEDIKVLEQVFEEARAETEAGKRFNKEVSEIVEQLIAKGDSQEKVTQ